MMNVKAQDERSKSLLATRLSIAQQILYLFRLCVDCYDVYSISLYQRIADKKAQIIHSDRGDAKP